MNRVHLDCRANIPLNARFSIAKGAQSNNYRQCSLITMEERTEAFNARSFNVEKNRARNERTTLPPLSHAENPASVFRIPRVSVMRSQISMDHRRLRGASTARHPSYYRFTGVYIFLHVLSNYIRRSLLARPAYGQFGFRTADG